MFTRTQLQAGQRLLQTLLPRARERLTREKNIKFRPMSALGKALAPHIRLDNIEAIVIHEAPLGGWYTDAVLKHVPPGVTSVFGTPVETPLPTRQAAQEQAVIMLTMIIYTEQNPQPDSPPTFLFHGYEINLNENILNQLPRGYGDPEQALQNMQQRLFPAGVPKKGLELRGEKLAEFMTVIHVAAKSGMVRYPSRKPKSPTGHGETTTRH